MNKQFEPATEIASYKDVPMIRRRWFYVTSFAFFIPAAIAIALTGPVYAKTKDGVAKYTKKSLRQLSLMMACFMVFGMCKVFLTR